LKIQNNRYKQTVIQKTSLNTLLATRRASEKNGLLWCKKEFYLCGGVGVYIVLKIGNFIYTIITDIISSRQKMGLLLIFICE